MGNVIDRVKRSAEEGFNNLLDLFGEQVTLYDGASFQSLYALVDKPLQLLNSDATTISRLDVTFQFLKSDMGTLTDVDKVRWDSRDFALGSTLTLNKDDNLGIYTCIGRYSY